LDWKSKTKTLKAQQSKGDEGTNKTNTSKFVSIDLEEIDAMIDEDVIAPTNKVLSEGIALLLQYNLSILSKDKKKSQYWIPTSLSNFFRN